MCYDRDHGNGATILLVLGTSVPLCGKPPPGNASNVLQMEAFLKVAGKLGLVRSVPESILPDNQAILNRIKATGDIPAGVEYFAAETKFSYTIKGDTDGERERNTDEAEG